MNPFYRRIRNPGLMVLQSETVSKKQRRADSSPECLPTRPVLASRLNSSISKDKNKDTPFFLFIFSPLRQGFSV